MKINLLRPCVIGVSVCLGIVAFAPVVDAAPKLKVQTGRLEIWPGQRVLVVLPLIVSDNFMSATNDAVQPATPSTPVAPDAPAAPVIPPVDGATADAPAPAPGVMSSAMVDNAGSSALADALKPLLSQQLSVALQDTGKFSVIRPYKFDPLLTRAVNEAAGQGLTADLASDFITTPSLGNSQNILGQLGLEQPGMVAQVVIQSLKVGGTQESPTVQLSMRGDLYEASSPAPFRTITVTSRPFEGKTPEDRLRAAAGQVFSDIAAAFVAPPSEFQLPLPPASAAGLMTGATPGAAMTPPTGSKPMTPAGNTTSPAMPPSTAPMPTPPVSVAPVTPQTPNGTIGTPLVPQLPGSTPPLGVNVPDQN